MPQTNAEKNKIRMERKVASHNLLKELFVKCGIMRHLRDGDGFDEGLKLLESGEFKLEFVEGNE